MKNLRERIPYRTKDFRIWTTGNRDKANAVMRAFGNSESFPFSLVTRDLSLAENLKDCSLLFFDIEEDWVIDELNKLEYEELVFSRMLGQKYHINLAGVLISKNDVLRAWERIENEKSKRD